MTPQQCCGSTGSQEQARPSGEAHSPGKKRVIPAMQKVTSARMGVLISLEEGQEAFKRRRVFSGRDTLTHKSTHILTWTCAGQWGLWPSWRWGVAL